MKLFWGLGKLLTLGFWTMVLVSAVIDTPKPFGALISMAALLILLIHVFEVLFFNASLRGRTHPWRDRGKIILFGIFHLQAIGRSHLGNRHA